MPSADPTKIMPRSITGDARNDPVDSRLSIITYMFSKSPNIDGTTASGSSVPFGFRTLRGSALRAFVMIFQTSVPVFAL